MKDETQKLASKKSLIIWQPTEAYSQALNISDCMKELGIKNYQDFYRWSIHYYDDFWKLILNKLQIKFDQPMEKLVDLSQGVENPRWFPGAKMNIINSCFTANPERTAIISKNHEGKTEEISYRILYKLVGRFSHGLLKHHLKPGDAVGIVMSMRVEAVVAYLGIIQAGCVVVSIPDSFSAEEIQKRLKIANVKAVVTQDKTVWLKTEFNIYEKIIAAHSPFAIVVKYDNKDKINILREGDIVWDDFLDDNNNFIPISCEPGDYTNILFSSGTTGEPKGIPWTHTTPIKCASDAYLYQNIKSGDVLCWPTSLGWMMGPWLIYAALINQATIALYEGSPTEKSFCEFMQEAGVTMLGIVPSIVKAWRKSGFMQNINLDKIKVFSSSGEPSNPQDMYYLSSLAGFKPIIEYCGGTEIGGAYITSTLLQPNALSRFTTPTLGLDFILLDEKDKPAQQGEVALMPPSIGLSTALINKDHHKVYFENMPLSPSGKILRRHGDELSIDSEGFYKMGGRTDDTMKLNGIKVSAIEIENILIQHVSILDEAAAIAITPEAGGPSLLVIYAVIKAEEENNSPDFLLMLKNKMQEIINKQLNPFFKIYDLVTVAKLPRTDSNKIQRKKLREEYQNIK